MIDIGRERDIYMRGNLKQRKTGWGVVRRSGVTDRYGSREEVKKVMVEWRINLAGQKDKRGEVYWMWKEGCINV